MKKTKIVLTFCIISMFFTGVVYSSPIAESITADLRPDIKIIIDGHTQLFLDYEGNEVYPIMYNGNTYISLRAVGEILNKTIKWNSKTNTIYIDSKENTNIINNSSSIKPTDPIVTQSDIETDDQNIQDFHKRVRNLFKEIELLQTVTEDDAILIQYDSILEKIKVLNDDIDTYKYELKHDLKEKSMPYENYKERKNELNIVKNELLSTENFLEEKTIKNYNTKDNINDF